MGTSFAALPLADSFVSENVKYFVAALLVAILVLLLVVNRRRRKE
jgi:hypothetical protein